MKTKLNKGFTLIELLVVIAIIGILAGIVLVSLNTARGKANDAAVKADLSGIRTAMEVYYSDTNNTYGIDADACDDAGSAFVDSEVAAYIDGLPSGSVPTCGASAQAYAIAATLPSPTSDLDSWCVDSAGANKEILTADFTAGDTVCP